MFGDINVGLGLRSREPPIFQETIDMAGGIYRESSKGILSSKSGRRSPKVDVRLGLGQALHEPIFSGVQRHKRVRVGNHFQLFCS